MNRCSSTHRIRRCSTGPSVLSSTDDDSTSAGSAHDGQSTISISST